MITIEIRGLGELQQRLQSFGMVGDVEVKIGNNTAYAPWVGSHRFQARVHQNRWMTDEQAIREELPEIERDFEAAVQAGLEATVLTENPLQVGAEAAALRLQTRMATYPQQRPGSRYRRTGTYGRRWTTTFVR